MAMFFPCEMVLQVLQVDVVPLDDVPDVIHKYHMCVVKNRQLDSKVIARAKQMKLIMQYGVGLEGIFLPHSMISCNFRMLNAFSSMLVCVSLMSLFFVILTFGLVQLFSCLLVISRANQSICDHTFRFSFPSI